MAILDVVETLVGCWEFTDLASPTELRTNSLRSQYRDSFLDCITITDIKYDYICITVSENNTTVEYRLIKLNIAILQYKFSGDRKGQSDPSNL